MNYVAPVADRSRHVAQHSSRGFAAVGLVRPKNPLNVGAVLRAAMCYDASFVAIQSLRPHLAPYIRQPTNVLKTERHVPILTADEILDLIPFDCVPVAVDLLEGAKPLPDFCHPRSAFYIFGPEDGTLGKSITDRCAHKVYIPTHYCLNLAMAANTVLYDRAAKAGRA